MIRENELKCVGKLLKPHGINGEITVLLTEDVDLARFSCIVLRLDGIFVPFFLTNVRPKSSETDLITIDGIDNEIAAAALCGNDVFAKKDELPDVEGDADGFYAADLIGFSIADGGKNIGKITGIDDTTENYLFIIEKADGSRGLIPVADEFITDIDERNRVITMNLPEGLVDL